MASLSLILAVAALLVAVWAATEARGSRRAAERSAHAAEISAHHQVTGAAAIIKQLGHADIHTTQRHYGHLEHGYLRDAALRAEAAVWSGTKVGPKPV